MAFMDEVVRKTQKAGQVIAEKATDVYGYTKSSFSIAALENKFNDKLIEIGAFVLDNSDGMEQDEQVLADLIAQAKELKEKISTERVERSKILDEVNCPTCGKANAKDAVYCSACGNKLKD